MKVTLHSTTRIVEINGVQARIWEGHTENGIPCHAFIPRIACSVDDCSEEFDHGLKVCRPPSAAIDAAYPIDMRLVL